MSLESVHEEDRTIVRNVVAAIQAMKKERILTSWTVAVDGPRYVVTAFVADGIDYEFSCRELELIHDVSPLRVLSVNTGRYSGKHVIRVLVSNKDQPLMLTEIQVLHVRKRSRWAVF